MKGSLPFVAFRSPVDYRQTPVRIEHSRKQRYASLQGQRSAFKVAHARQCKTQSKMPHRQKVLESDRNQRVLSRFLILPFPEKRSR